MRATRPSLLARAGSAAAVAVLAGGGVVATAAAADAGTVHHHHGLQATRLSIKNKVIAHSHHHADAVTGVLSSDHKGVASETVTLVDRSGHHRKWAVVGTGTTGTDGSVSFTVAPTVKTQYKLVFAGDTTYRGSHSNVVLVKG